MTRAAFFKLHIPFELFSCHLAFKLINVRSSELLSKEWCDIVFENRNRDYGAYRLRQRAGARYRYALTVVVGGFLLTAAMAIGTALYVRYMLQREAVSAQDLLNELKPTNLKEGYKMHFVQTARLAPRIAMAPGAKQGAPVIVEGNPKAHIIGVKDKITFQPDDKLIITPIDEETRLHDSTLPLAKQKIVPTEIVKQLPEFPGGTAIHEVAERPYYISATLPRLAAGGRSDHDLYCGN